MIQSGYKIPFHTTPDPYYFDNKSSALRRKSFVEFQIRELLVNGCISEVSDYPEFINPLHVAVQPSGKERLILDLSHLNNFIVKTHVKYEDLKTVLQLLKKGDYVFSFDLKSAYHNVDIFEEHRKYLSFCWQFSDGTVRYFHFNVLPFGLSPAPQVFTILMRQLINFWRAKAIGVVIYIDDGIGGAGTFENAAIISQQVKSDLVGCGFTLNKKSVWTPTQQLPWLGHILNFKTGIIAITEEKINKLKQSIRVALSVNRIKVLELASIAGQIIARAKAIGVVIYIDDGIGGAGTFENAAIISQQVKSDLVGCGFTLNKKSVWTPTQQLPWLGHILNFKTGIIAITEEKINKLKQSIRVALSVNRIKVLELASIAGQIIAMSLAIGSWARLMTSSMFLCISHKRNWSSTVVLNQDAQNELNFWLAKVY